MVPLNYTVRPCLYTLSIQTKTIENAPNTGIFKSAAQSGYFRLQAVSLSAQGLSSKRNTRASAKIAALAASYGRVTFPHGRQFS